MVQDQLHDSLALLECNEADLVSHEYDVVLVANLVEDSELAGVPDVCEDSIGNASASDVVFVRSLFLEEESVEELLASVSPAVKCPEREDEVPDEDLHVLVVLDDQVDVPVLQLQRNAVPTTQRNEFILLAQGHRYEVLTQHPKARRLPTVHEAHDVRDLATCARLHLFEVFAVLYEFLRESEWLVLAL